jgi:hypothetical protein
MRKRQRSWLSLVTFCAATVLIVALGSAVLLAGASVAFAFAHPSPAENPSTNEAVVLPVGAQTPAAPPLDSEGNAAPSSFAGMITDSLCGARHRRNSGKTSAECARACVRNGAHYMLVDGETIYSLAGDSTPLEKLAGERVSLSGILKNDTITVESVTPGPAQ